MNRRDFLQFIPKTVAVPAAVALSVDNIPSVVEEPNQQITITDVVDVDNVYGYTVASNGARLQWHWDGKTWRFINSRGIPLHPTSRPDSDFTKDELDLLPGGDE